jgi:hypothetical protein
MSDWKNPDHYKKQGFEAIDVIRSVLTEEQYTGYLIGNSLKYLLRINDKDTPVMNLGKSCWYSSRAEEFLKDHHDNDVRRQD